MLYEQLNAQCQCVPIGADAWLSAPQALFLPRQTRDELVEATGQISAALHRLRPRAAATELAGIFNSFDFHITPEGPRLIEINVNAGGAFLQPGIAASVPATLPNCPYALSREPEFNPVDTLLAAWHRHQGSGLPQRIAVIDDAPEQQPLYPDMQLAQQALWQRGVDCDILDPATLRLEQGRLFGPSGPIDMVYNRLTDFSLTEPRHAVLLHADRAGTALIAPNPRVWQAYADKALLVDLADLEPRPAAILPAKHVTPACAEQLWQTRRSWVFKPLQGHGSKGVYRGDKLTRRKWQDIMAGGYVAQSLARPGQRTILTAEGQQILKSDIRVWTHGSEPLHIAARLFSGQVTSLRGETAGFAPIYWVETPMEAEFVHFC